MQDHQAASREIQRFHGIHGEQHVLRTVDVEAPARGPAVLQSVLSVAISTGDVYIRSQTHLKAALSESKVATVASSSQRRPYEKSNCDQASLRASRENAEPPFSP